MKQYGKVTRLHKATGRPGTYMCRVTTHFNFEMTEDEMKRMDIRKSDYVEFNRRKIISVYLPARVE